MTAVVNADDEHGRVWRLPSSGYERRIEVIVDSARATDLIVPNLLGTFRCASHRTDAAVRRLAIRLPTQMLPKLLRIGWPNLCDELLPLLQELVVDDYAPEGLFIGLPHWSSSWKVRTMRAHR